MTTNPNASTPLRPLPRVVDRLLLDVESYVSCEECFDRLDSHVEQLLAGGAPEPDLEAHLRGCPACAEDVESLRSLLQADAEGRP